MEGPIKLYKLVDLALCDPEVGAVNFNHLRTLLLSILKLTNQTNTFVDPTGITSKSNIIINSKINSNLENIDESTLPDISVIPEDGHKSSLKGDTQEERGDLEEHITDDVTMSKQTIDIKTFLLNQRNLEKRIFSLEKILQINEEFPLNDEILNDNFKEGEEINTFKGADDSIKLDNYKLRTIWQNKKSIGRLDGAEEAIDKLFSLMNDILSKDKSHELKDDYENMKNQLVDLQNQLDQYKNDTNDHKDNIQSNKSLIEEWLSKVQHLGEVINENSSNLAQNVNKSDKNCKDIEEIQVQTKDYREDQTKSAIIDNQITNLEVNIDKLMSMLDEKIDISELDKKVDKSELDKKVNTTDLEIIQNEITRLTEVQEKMLNLDKIGEQLDLYVSKTDGILSEIRKELAQLNQSVANIDDEKLKEMLDKTEGLSSISDNNEEIDEIKSTIRNILTQLEQNEKLQHEMTKAFDDLNANQNEPRFSTKEIDTSVLAAIQHLAQENRQQITAIQGNIKMLQKLQMPLLPAVPKDDNSDGDNDKGEMFEILQNHILTLQEEQVKQSGNISNMVDDYKEEFNRKQLHIDALYDYIEKLQHDKANREDIFSVEMNIKADKQSLDNKVSMTTFDERYQMLEQALQQALSRLDQYVEEEASLKGEFSKLSEDLSSKMDTDAGKQLKKFLDERLKAIQVSRTHLPDVRDIRDGAAGLRKPMPLHYNCLSCDRTIDVTMRGILPSVPYNMPARSPLATLKHEKRCSSSSYNSMAANRPCGGSHTSVNVNMLRTMKVIPLQCPSDYNVITKPASGNEMPITDRVIGSDGQIYRGRLKSQEISTPKQSSRNSGRSKPRMIHSASMQNKSNDIPKVVDRAHSATWGENKDESDNPYYLPYINDNVNGQPSS